MATAAFNSSRGVDTLDPVPDSLLVGQDQEYLVC